MSPPARILMTADAVGGVWTYALDLAAGLAPLGLRDHARRDGTAGGRAADGQDAAKARPFEGWIDTGLPVCRLDWAATEPADILEIRRRDPWAWRRSASGPTSSTSTAPRSAAVGGFRCAGGRAPAIRVSPPGGAAVKDGDDAATTFGWRTQRPLARASLACDALVATDGSPSRMHHGADSMRCPIPFVVQNGRAALRVALRDEARNRSSSPRDGCGTRARMWEPSTPRRP
jgi:glycogen(starch) synthase